MAVSIITVSAVDRLETARPDGLMGDFERRSGVPVGVGADERGSWTWTACAVRGGFGFKQRITEFNWLPEFDTV
jgi:hypothetical protein